MKSEQLIRMANQIGTFFESMPDRQAAVEDVATHLKQYWEPRMRQQLVTILHHDPASPVCAIVREAVVQHRQHLVPAS